MTAAAFDALVECVLVEPDHDLSASREDVDVESDDVVGATATAAPKQVPRR